MLVHQRLRQTSRGVPRSRARRPPGGVRALGRCAEPKLVLVADDNDNDDILALVTFSLERAGHTAIQARDSEEALRMAGQQRASLAILDLRMPRLDGYEVTRGIRSDPAIADMPVVLLTARSQEADVARGFDVGADDYIRKPFSPQELLARVQAILARR